MAPSTEGGEIMIPLPELKKRIQNSSLLATFELASDRIDDLTEAPKPVKKTKLVQSPGLMPPERIQNAKARLFLNLKVFCLNIDQLCSVKIDSSGYLAPEEGYWFVPELGIKISFSTGGYFDLDKPQSRNPMKGDLINLWMVLKNHRDFKRAIIEIERWCDDLENGDTKHESESSWDPSESKKSLFLNIFIF